MTAEPDRIDVHDDRARNAYEAVIDGTIVGVSYYRGIGDRIVVLHTEVEPAYEGRGVGSAIARFVLADLRARDLRLTPRCPFFAGYLERHPEDADLVDWGPGQR
jgi:predicted GNAT family acetyltransferase